jgi:NADH-quinone oxidoreductase subunit N
VTPDVDWFALAPALSLLAAGGVALLGAVIVPRPAARLLAAVAAAAGFVVAFVFAALLFADADEARPVIADAFARDRWTALASMIVCGAGLLAVGVSWRERLGRNEDVGEYYALLSAAAAGMVFFVGASNLMVLFLGLEWFSLSLYVMCAIAGDRAEALEAGLKYLIVGSFGSAVLLFGSALVYGATGELTFSEIADASAAQGLSDDPLLLAGLAMMIAGLGFKASAAPFHMWTPDVYQGAPTSVTAFMSAATKTAALVVTLRVLVTAFPEQEEFWTIAVAVLACASLAIGNLAALVQRDVKRLIAYSSVSHAGFMLIAVAANNELGARALMYYLIPYSAMSIGSFAVVAARERELGVPVTFENLAGMGWERPLLGFAMWVFMLGFAGLPLTGGFVGKFYVFSAAYEAGWTWLIIVGVAATAVSVYYYLAVVRALYMRSGIELRAAPAGGSPPRETLLQASVVACLGVTVATFFAVQPLIDLAKDAADQLPF